MFAGYFYQVGELHVDFKHAESSIKKGSKTFYFASRFMGCELRDSFYAVYAFCRHTDNLIDDNENNPKLQRILIRQWKKEFLDTYKNNYSTNPILNSFVYTMKKYNIPLRYPLELIRGVKTDITKKEYATFAELRRYCYRVASVVGIMLTYVMGVGDISKAKKYATKLGIAMQLTNILRDVGEDARLGRVYFPKDELAQFGLTLRDILSLKRTKSLIEFLKFQIERARRYYAEAVRGISMLQKDVRPVISLAFTLYREILGVIEENGYEVYSKRAYVNIFRKIFLYLHLMFFGSSMPIMQVSPENSK